MVAKTPFFYSTCGLGPSKDNSQEEGVQYRFDDEVKDDTHGDFTPEMFNLPQTTWITTFVESVTDKST